MARVVEPPGQGPRRGEGHWLWQYARASAPRSPAPDAPPPPSHSRPDLRLDHDGDYSSHVLNHSADLGGRQNQPSADAAGIVRDAQIPSDAQAIPCPALPEIAAESAERGIALAVTAGLLDHGGMGAEESGDAQGTADRPPCVDEGHDAQEKGGEERAAKEVDVEASARAPDAANRQGGSTQHARGPTNTPARWAARQAEEEELAHARSGGRARLRRGAQRHADETRQAQAPAARALSAEPSSSRSRPADGSITPDNTAADASAPANGYARTAERLMREGVEGGEEAPSEEAEEEVENEESDGGDPVFNPEREGMLEAEAEEDEEELELLLRGAEFPSPNARGEPANRTTARNRAAGGIQARGGNRAATENGVDSTAANGNSAAPIPTPPMLKPDDLAKNSDLFAQVADWDLDPLRDRRQPPLARHPPKDLRESFAICLLTPLLHLAANPESAPGWNLLTFLPRILLRTSSARKPDWSAMMNRLLRFRQGFWAGLYEEAAEAISLPPQPRHAPEVLDALTARHPPACQMLPEWLHAATAENSPAIEARDFRRLIAKLPNGVGAGPSGTTFEHIRDAALGNAEVFTHLLALSNTALAGKLPAVAGELLTASRLLAFTKPHGGTRPIAVGECLLRVIAKAALFLIAPVARSHFAPLQFGVAVVGGIEAAIHTARTYLEVHSKAGVQILGSPIGTPQGCASAVRERLATAAAPLPLLAQMDPQLSLLLLTRYVSRRASFLARITPLEALPVAEWSTWGE
ncbi:unnamed protein product [Closterium sp. Naga37s-1]|nr:unnamed protein product [Closterium sp. Naga37s-1]